MSTTVTFPLTKGKTVTVDVADMPLVSQYQWHAAYREQNWYACSSRDRRKGGKAVYLHRLIMGAADDQEVDHRDHNGLNCTRSNMRLCSRPLNGKNLNKQSTPTSSKYKGVSFDKKSATGANPWAAYIDNNRRHIKLGHYRTENDAARAYNAASVKYHGEYGKRNVIEGLTYEESIVPPTTAPWVVYGDEWLVARGNGAGSREAAAACASLRR